VTSWHILTGEYPPQPGGVSDYTRLVAKGLAEAGDGVHVWSGPCAEPSPAESGVEVHRLPDNFGPRSLKKLGEALNQSPAPRRILVQYVPHAFGWKALNLPFCFWLRSRRKDSVRVFFHEVAFPLDWRQPPLHNVLGVGTRLMASLVIRAAERIFVSIPSWEQMVRSLGAGLRPVTWLPIPSNIPVVHDAESKAAIRARYARHGDFVIGHFGTYGVHVAGLLKDALPALLREDVNRVVILLGRGGDAVRGELIARDADLAARLFATGDLSAADLSKHLQAVDLMLQLYPDGISTRRTSAMAGLQHGLPLVTTTGHLTESLWSESQAALLAPVGDVTAITRAVRRLQEDDKERARMGAVAAKLYQERFEMRHTIAFLRDDASRGF